MNRFLLTVVAAVISQPVAAKDYDAGSEFVVWSGENNCKMAAAFERGTRLIFYFTAEGALMVTVGNQKWTPDDTSVVKVETEDTIYTRAALATPHIIDGSISVVFEKPYAFLDDIGRSSYLHFKKEDGSVIDRLSMEGSGAGVLGLKHCYRDISGISDSEQYRREGLADIPENPF